GARGSRLGNNWPATRNGKVVSRVVCRTQFLEWHRSVSWRWLRRCAGDRAGEAVAGATRRKVRPVQGVRQQIARSITGRLANKDSPDFPTAIIASPRPEIYQAPPLYVKSNSGTGRQYLSVAFSQSTTFDFQTAHSGWFSQFSRPCGAPSRSTNSLR